MCPGRRRLCVFAADPLGPGAFSDYATTMSAASRNGHSFVNYDGDDKIGYYPGVTLTAVEEDWAPDVDSALLDQNKPFRGLYSSSSAVAVGYGLTREFNEGELRRTLPPHHFGGDPKLKSFSAPTDTSVARDTSYNYHRPMVRVQLCLACVRA